MKIAVVVGTSMLGLLLGTTAVANAQHGRDDKQTGSEKQRGNEHQKEHGRSSAQQHSDKHQANRSEERREQRPHEQQRAHETGNHQANRPEHVRPVVRHEPEHHGPRDVWQGHRAQHWQREHHTWRERGGYRGYRIPEDRFRAHFGRGHWFRVHSVPIIVVDGFPRFQYGGFWFSMVDPWPEYWARTWYETDDVYVDYVNDGYYLYNRRHPGVAIAVNVSF
jgi:hypothetical protein